MNTSHFTISLSLADFRCKKNIPLKKKLFYLLFLGSFLCVAVNGPAQNMGITTTGSTSYPTSVVGDNNIRTGTVGITVNILQAANKFTVTGPLTLTSVSIYINTSYSGHNMKFAVYPDNGGSPAGQTLTGQTGSYLFTSATGWITFNLNTADYMYIPAAGTYWLCFMGDFSGGQVLRLGSSLDYYYTQTYSSGYPATFSNSPTSENAGTYSFYATGVQIKGYAKATKADLPANGTFSSVSFYSHAAGNARLAIYSNSGSAPSAKQWESDDITITSAGLPKWTTLDISAANLNLIAGTYWLAWQWNSTANAPSYNSGSAGDGNYMIKSTYGSFPATWSGGTSSVEKWSMYTTYSTCVVPTIYTVSGGGSYCSGGTGKDINLSNSETGVNYELYKDAAATGTILPGSTGSGLTFSSVTSAGTYTVMATRVSGGCTGAMSGNAVIHVNPLPFATVASQTNISCNGGNNGALTILAAGGTAPYTFSINNGFSYFPGNSFSLLTAGTYQVRVIDNNGCESVEIPTP